VTGADAVAAVRDKVEGHLRASGLDVAADFEGDYMIRRPGDSAIVWIRPVAWEGDHTLVRVWSVTNVDVPVDGALAKFVLTANARWPVGGLRIDDRGPLGPIVIFSHSLLGAYLNRVELQFAIAAVTAGAHVFGSQIKDRFGGTLFNDASDGGPG
jgi:hypothetical protein